MFKLQSKLIFLVVILISTFTSCQKENLLEESEITKESSQIESEIGMYHNKILDMYYSSNLNTSELDHKIVRKDIINLVSDYDNELFDKVKINKNVKQSEKVLSSLEISFSFKSKESSTSDFIKIIDYLEANGEISKKLNKQLKYITNSVLEGKLSSAENLVLVNSLNKTSWNNRDSKYVSAFTQVYNSSYDYWSNKNNDKVNRVEADGDTVIIADAIGALYGLILSPVFSIIEGAIFSLIANNQQ